MKWPVSLGALCWLCIALLSPSGHADIRLSGVPKPLKGQIADHLKSTDFPCDSPTGAASKILQQSDRELTRALQALGYFNARFERTLLFKPTCWQLSYQLTLGKPVLIRESAIVISGAAQQEKVFADLLAKYPLKPGSPFSNENYEKLKETLQARGLRQGYFDATLLEHRVDIYPELNVADISLAWNSGERYRFGEITIDQSVLLPGLFRNLLSLKSADPYNLSTLQNDRIRLSESGYFETVEITPLLDQADEGRVPVQVLATRGNPSSYEAGVGFSTDTGARLRSSYSRHLINSRGHQAKVSLLLSQVVNTLNFNYVVPWRNPRTDSLRADVSYLDEDNESFQSQRWETTLTDSQLLDSGWTQSLSLGLSTENSTIAGQQNSSVHLVPGISWERVSADNLVYPDKGYSLSLALLGSTKQVISDSSFLQLQATGKWIRTLPWRVRLLTRGTLGYTLVDSIEDLPTSRRFFSGGDNSIRGYEYQSLGPTEDGEVIGGKHKAVASIELERPVYKKWSIATFVDTGNAWNDRFDPVTGVGLGVRWHSPIGPLRVDIGVPLDDSDDNFRIHINFGPQL